MEEIWKDIKNYEGLYQVSNFGRIKSLQREFYNKNQYDLEGDFIKTWNSLSEASKKLNLSCANLSSCCLKKYGHKTCGGYKWEFTN